MKTLILTFILLFSSNVFAQTQAEVQTTNESRCELVASLAYSAGIFRTAGKSYLDWMNHYDTQVVQHPSFENIRKQVSRVGQLVYAVPDADPSLNRRTMREYCIKFPDEFFD